MIRESQWSVGLAFAATAVASVSISAVGLAVAVTDGAAQALEYGLDVMKDAPLETLLVLVVSAAAGGMAGGRRAGSLGCPSTGRRGRVSPDVGRGMLIASQAFVAGTIALAFALGLTASVDPVIVLAGGVYASVLLLLVGSSTVLPVALALFGLVAWQIGRAHDGTPAEAVGLDESSPSNSDA